MKTVRFIAPSDVAVYGANDIESWCNSSGGGCASAAAAKDWARGYSGVGAGNCIDFGSADQCPTNTYSGVTCGNTNWTQYDYWYLSWGNPDALPAPEIYHDDWAMQWEMIDLYGVHHWPANGAMLFEGPMDEFDLDSSTDTAAQAWNALRSALEASSSTDQQFFYSLEVHTQ